MYLVKIEVVIGFPRAILFQFRGRDVIEVDDGGIGLLTNGEDGRREVGEFALDALRVVSFVVVAWGKREEDRRSTFGTNLLNESASIATKGIDGLLLLGHLIVDGNGVVTHLQFSVRTIGRAGTNGVDGAVVVVTKFEEDIIAFLHRLEDWLPEQCVEGAWRGSTQGVVLDRDFIFIEILVGIESPSPLSVIAIAECACPHGAVAHEEEHGIVALTTATWYWTRLIGDVDGVGGEVTYTVDVNPDVALSVKSCKIEELKN